MKSLKRVLIMAGGTGGHIFPGLSLAHYLRNQQVDVHWLGTSQGLEAQLVKEAGFPLHLITINGLRGKGIKTWLTAPVKIGTAIFQSRRIIKTIHPDIIIGMGGFASGPGGIAGWSLRIPLLIHEQNAKAGLTNKILARLANQVIEGFEATFTPMPKVISLGNPVRAEIESLPPPNVRFNAPHSPYRLLILGGSLGAKALNDIVPKALAQLPHHERPTVLHQTGDKHFDATKKAYESNHIQATLIPFIKDMASAYAWADMVLCRAGALTVAELCAAGLGAIFVPYPFAVDDHQTANANVMVKKGAALCIPQSELTETKLANMISDFSTSPEKCLTMAEAAYQLRKINVPEKIFDILLKMMNSKRRSIP